MSKSSKRWLARQRRDPYVRRAAQGDLGSRAHFKLEQLDKRFRLISAHTGGVLDLGAAPGGWTRYVVSRGPRGPIVAADQRVMPPIDGAEVLTLDLSLPAARRELSRRLPSGADLVLSDMAPNISGVKAADRAASEELVEIATQTALVVLNRGGNLVVKMFQGAEVDAWVSRLRDVFERVVLAKPAASRVGSREVYGVALKRRDPASTLLEGETHV